MSKQQTKQAVEAIKEIIQDGEWKSVQEITEKLNESVKKNYTTRAVGLILRPAVARNEMEKKRMIDAGIRYLAIRLAPSSNS